MAVKVIVRNKRQIIVPLRFGRAVVDQVPVSDAPDVDDRGFALGSRYKTWGKTNTRGPQVSMTAGDTIRIKILTEDIDGKIGGSGNNLQLFATSSNIQVVTVVNQGQPIGTDGVLSIKGLVDLIDVPVKVQIHMNRTDGPVLAEVEPHIFQVRQLNVKAHLVTINGGRSAGTSTSATTTRTADSLVQLFNDVNAIWRAGGIQFVCDQNDIDADATINLSTIGTVTTNLPSDSREFDQLLELNKDPNQINVYFVNASSDNSTPWAGLTTPPGQSGTDGVAIVDQQGGTYLSEQQSANALAHELGHYLNLDHYDENPQGHQFRHDIWSERHLMFSGVFQEEGVMIHNKQLYRSDVGYGEFEPGALIDLKNLNADPEDGELHIARRASLAIVGGA